MVEGWYGATVYETGSESQFLTKHLEVRLIDLDPIRELPYGPATFEWSHQRPDRRQHLTTSVVPFERFFLHFRERPQT
jgi:hypothetical protein